jgi:CRISPR-associated exonuclease Cas4
VIDEEDYLPISALQHLVFCPRQCALIHIEREWNENVLTARGRLEHERVHEGFREFRRGRRLISGLSIHSKTLALQGKLDILELDLIDSKGPDNLASFRLKGVWYASPVEFKHGEPKKNDCDRIQLCAQALCVEEMTGLHIDSASLFYQRIRRREDVLLDESLRASTVEAAKRLHELFDSGKTPIPVYQTGCKYCSMKDICMPKKMGKRSNRYRTLLFHLPETLS